MAIISIPKLPCWLRIALIIMAVMAVVSWAGYQWLVSTAKSKLNQALTERGLSLTAASQSWSILGGITLKDAVLRHLSAGNEPLIEISNLHLDILWREAWHTHAAVTRWRADDASLTLHDEQGAVSLQHFTTDFAKRDDNVSISRLDASDGPLTFSLTGKILTAANTAAPKTTNFALNLKPLRGVLESLQFKPGTGPFNVTGIFSVDLRQADVIWDANLHGTGKQVEWRGVPMMEAQIEAQVSQAELKLSSQLTFAQGSAHIDLTRAGWEQKPLILSGTLTDSKGRNDEFKGQHQITTGTLTITRLSGNANLLELAQNIPSFAAHLPATVKVTTFPDIVAKDFVWHSGDWTLASLQLRTPAAMEVMIRSHPLTIDHLTGGLSYDHRTWRFDGLKGQLLGGHFALDASYDGKTLSKATVSLQTLRLSRLTPWLKGTRAGLEDTDLSLTYRGDICNEPTHSTGSGTLELSHAPVIHIPLLDQAYDIFPKLLPDKQRSGTGEVQVAFSMTHGTATIDPLKASSKSLIVTATGTVDLVKRQVAGHARAHLRGIVGVATSPLSHVLTEMQVSGSLDDIRVSPMSPGAAVKNMVTETANVGTGTVKLSSTVLREGMSLPFEALGMFGKDKAKSSK